MKFSAALVLGGIIAFFLFPGCSKEENLPPPREKQKVVRPAGIVAVEQREAVSVPEEKRAASQEQTEKVKEEALERKLPEAEEKPEDKGGAPEYVVKDGDSLATIAGQIEGYKDPLKWIILLRFNLEALDQLPETPDFAEKKLPPGTKLKVEMPRRSNVSGKEIDNLWVVNAMSARSNEEIVPLAVRLARSGFPVYMTRVQVKGQEWVRLRVGYFVSKTEAQEAGRKIRDTVRAEEPWILKVNKEEYEEFAGFLKRESGA